MSSSIPLLSLWQLQLVQVGMEIWWLLPLWSYMQILSWGTRGCKVHDKKQKVFQGLSGILPDCVAKGQTSSC